MQLRRTGLMLAAGSIAMAMAACSSGTSSTSTGQSSGGGEPVEITVLTFETPNLPGSLWDSQIKLVTDQMPGVKVKKLVSPNVDRNAYAKQLLASGQLPDVMVAVNPAGFAETGNLAAFSDDELRDFLAPKAGQIGGKTYQLPTNTQVIPYVFYNKALFAKAGVTGTPKTYAELLAAAEKLKGAGVQPFLIGGGGDAFASSLILDAIISVDVYGKDPDWMHKRRKNQVKFDSPEFAAALTKFKELVDKGFVNKSDLSRNYAQTQQAFLDGKGAMYPMGTWFVAAAKDAKFDIGYFPFPSEDGSLKLPSFTGGGLTVNAKSKHLAEAKKFALTWSSTKAINDNGVTADALFPAVKGYTFPDSVSPLFKDTFKAYQAAATQGQTVPAFSWEAGDDAALPGVVEKINAGAQDLITGKATSVQQVLQSWDVAWDKAAK